MKTMIVCVCLLAALATFGLSEVTSNIGDLAERIDQLQQVHIIREDGSTCHIDPDDVAWCDEGQVR